jgi:uncharacterized damage-inducible protein DinB
MTDNEFESVRMRAARFQDVDLSGALFRGVNLADSRFRGALFSRAQLRGVQLDDVTIDGDIKNLVVNGVDVAPLVEAELDRRSPDRVKMRPADAAGFREGYEVVSRLWDGTVDRARTLPPELLNEQVDDEWSFIQTLRHLVYATECWVHRAMLGQPRPWHDLSLPFTELGEVPGVTLDIDARPALHEVLALREDRRATVRRVLDELTDEQLASTTEPVDAPGWPPAEAFPVKECLLVVLNEEWHHRLYAERDLAVLEASR